MESICADSFWDHNLTWGDDRPYPEFTRCFQDTVLLWLPNLLLWLATPVYIYALLQFPDEIKNWSLLSGAKLSAAVAQLSIRYLQLTNVDQTVSGIRMYGLCFDILTLLLTSFYVVIERRKGFVTSGVQTFYWLLTCLFSGVLVYSDMIGKEQVVDSEESHLKKGYLVLACAQFLLTWLPDCEPLPENSRENPELRNSFLNRIFYFWFDSFMNIGPLRPLEEKDVREVKSNTTTCIPKWERLWKEERQRLVAKQKPGEEIKVSMAKVVLKNDWPSLLADNFMCMLFLSFKVANPLIMGSFVRYLESETQAWWKGYFLVATLCLSALCECISLNFMIELGTTYSLRNKVTLTSALFKKSLTMTNKERASHTSGEITNLLTDVDQFRHFLAFIHWNWEMPINLIASLAILYISVENAMFVGVAVMCFFIPMTTYAARNECSMHRERQSVRDERVKLMTEILNGIKVLKLYAWELVYGEKIMEIRKKEMKILDQQQVFSILGTLAWDTAPTLMSVAMFGTYVLLNEDHKLDAGTAFQAMATFGMLTYNFSTCPHVVAHVVRSLTSMRRLEKFLNSQDIDEADVTHEPSDDAICIENGQFTWDKSLGPCLKDINLTVPKGGLVAVVGTVGCGKSSLLSALLGEMEKDHGKVNVFGATAYVPQQAWIQCETLRNNILFGKKHFDSVYNDVIDACALQRDLDILPGGDMTEIGEKGINLSGGQKQRVSIARSVYYNADVYLFDDPLSAVDSHVGKHIFEHVIGEHGLLRNKTRVLVTHGITWLPFVDKIVVMDNGHITESGTYKDLLSAGNGFADFIKKFENSDQDVSDDEENVFDEVKVQLDLNSAGMEDTPEALLETNHNMRDLQRLLSDSGYSSPTEPTQARSRNNSESDKRRRTFRRTISRALSKEDKMSTDSDSDKDDELDGGKKKLIRQATFDDKFKLTEKHIKSDADKCDSRGKIIEEDELQEGKVQMKYITPYFKSFGFGLLAAICLFIIVCRYLKASVDWCTRDWADDKDLRNMTLLPSNSTERLDLNLGYIKHFLFLTVVTAVFEIMCQYAIGRGVVRAATYIHDNMLKNILRGPMAFFDTTPVGRICARFSHDIEPLDGAIARQMLHLLHSLISLILVFFVVVSSMPLYILMIIPMALIGYEIQKRFLPVRRQLSRFWSKSNTPVASHFSECLGGTSTIRAYNMQQDYADQNNKRVQRAVEVRTHLNNTDRWLGIRLELLDLLSFSVAACLALNSGHLGASVVGLVVFYARKLSDGLNGFIRCGGEMEHNVVCIERIGEYSSRPQEAALHTEVMPKKSWPDRGEVTINDLSLRYRDGLPLVIKNVNVKVTPGEKIGIVGRTGAGKSSLTLGLFRIVEPATGNITIDDHDIGTLGLFDLRTNLTILPQDPVLFTGSIRSNLDPMNAYSDEKVFQALEHAHLKSFIDSLPDKLNYECGEGGKNLSVGQRQLICLARSLLRKSQVLVLDEATAAVDMQTDELIQNTIKEEFKYCTVLTIAHRLNTIIDYDRILVLDHGEVKEFDSPRVLLENKKSEFYSMAKDAGLVK